MTVAAAAAVYRAVARKGSIPADGHGGGGVVVSPITTLTFASRYWLPDYGRRRSTPDESVRLSLLTRLYSNFVLFHICILYIMFPPMIFGYYNTMGMIMAYYNIPMGTHHYYYYHHRCYHQRSVRRKVKPRPVDLILVIFVRSASESSSSPSPLRIELNCARGTIRSAA